MEKKTGLAYAARLESLNLAGYRIEIVYLRLTLSTLALQRVAMRVRQGGHAVPDADVLRRLSRSWSNFQRVYKPLADVWSVYDNEGSSPKLLEEGP